MMDETGIIKYKCHWHDKPLKPSLELDEIIEWRNLAKKDNYIGISKNGIGFGNISIKVDDGFIISGSATGHLVSGAAKDFALAYNWNIQNNQVWCSGETKASSEALSHAIIYNTLTQVNTILHIHHHQLWKKYYYILPSTAVDIEYGTPAMALGIQKLLSNPNNNSGIILMKGHQNGLISYGESFKNVFEQIERLTI